MIAGKIVLFAGSTVPEGYLVCDGTAVSRSTYSTLFDAIGTTYGVGDGSTTFNLPDLTGRVAIGVSGTYSLGSSGGEEAHSLSVAEIPAHLHTVPQHGHGSTIKATTPVLTHTVTQPAYNYTRANGTAKRMNYGKSCVTGRSSTNATRSTNFAISNHAAADCTMSGGISDCQAFDTGLTGEGAYHNNMMPFITMNYIISTGD